MSSVSPPGPARSPPTPRAYGRPSRSPFAEASRRSPSPPRPGKTLLESAVAAGLRLPWSCGMGGCGACTVRRVSGDVVMQEPNCLSAAERGAGDTLTCVGYAAGPLTLELRP
ncbi:MAG: 2Fe-2S iron-sulfur cluster binding domain-containing protein [Deltaproteobacteria bacterium]|nr:2Fe-2S iron-sulfur cluster binding domain-containing protein [Deltaproteobacteria bacterium]